MPDLASQQAKELPGTGAGVPSPEEVESSGGPADEAIQLNVVIRIAPVETPEEKEPEDGTKEKAHEKPQDIEEAKPDAVVAAESKGEKELSELSEPVDVVKQEGSELAQAKPETTETPEVVLEEEKRVREILEFEVNLCKERNLGSMIPKAEELLHVGTPVGEPAEYAEAPLQEGQPSGTTVERSESLIAEEPTVVPERAGESEAGEPILEASHLNKGPMSDWETELQRLRDSRLHETPHRAAEEKQVTKPEAEGASPGPSAEPGAATLEPIVIVYERDVLGLLTPEYEVRMTNEREIRLRPPQQQETSVTPTWFEGPAKAEEGYSKSPDIHHVSFPIAGGPPPPGGEKPETTEPPIEHEDMKKDEAGAPEPLGPDEEKEPSGAVAEGEQLVERQPSTAEQEEGEKSLAERTLDAEQVPSAASLTSAEGGGPDEKRTFLGAQEALPGELVEEAMPEERKAEVSEETEPVVAERLESAGPSRVFLPVSATQVSEREEPKKGEIEELPFTSDQTALVELAAKPEESKAGPLESTEGTEPILPEKQVDQQQPEPTRMFLESRAVPEEEVAEPAIAPEVAAEKEEEGFIPATEAAIQPEHGEAIEQRPIYAIVERPESSLEAEVVPIKAPETDAEPREVVAIAGVEEGLVGSMLAEEPKTTASKDYGGTSDWDVMSRESLHARPSTRTADTQTEMSTDALFRSKDVREASTYAFLSEENEEVRRAPDDYLPLYLHRVTLNDKPSIAEMIRKLTPASEEWEEAVPMNWKVNPAKDLEKWPSPCIQDVRSPIIVLFGGINLSALGEVLTGCLILRYNIEDNEWRRCNMMPLPRYGHRCVFLNNEVYIIGGFDNRDATYGLRMSTSFCFRYHAQTGEWNVTAPLKHARGYHGVAVLNNSIYAVGGVDANDLLLSSVERYDHEEDKWVMLEKGLYCGRMGMGVAAFQGSLWVVGGIVQISGLQTCSTAYVEIYNPATDQWTYAANYLPSPRTCVSLLNVNDTELYCFGGIFYNCVGPTRKLLTIDDILVYSEKKKVWRQVSCMPAPRHNAHVLQYKSEAYVVGGQDVEKPDHPLTSIIKTTIPTERFSWGPLRDVPLPISAYGAVVIPPLEESERSAPAV